MPEVAAVLYGQRDGEPDDAWLARLALVLLAREPDPATVAALAHRLLTWFDPSAERRRAAFPAAHVDLFRRLAERHPARADIAAVFADALTACGSISVDALLDAYLAAFALDPREVFGRDGDLGDWFEGADRHRRVRYRAYTIRAAELDDPEGNRDYVAERLGALLAEIGDDAGLIAELAQIVGPLLRRAVD